MINGNNQRRVVFLAVFFIVSALFPYSATGAANPLQEIKQLLGRADAALLADPSGRVIVGVHTGKLLVPASTLKLLTALAARHYLGENYRFQTDFYVRDDGSLVIKGFGDPLMVSEDVQGIAAILRKHINFVHHIVLDDTYFAKPLIIPGTANHSLQPYDAPCGALSVNFNSFAFQLQNGEPVSPEPQTPLLPIARTKIDAIGALSNMPSGRIPLSRDKNEVPLYTGQLLEYFLRETGIRITGGVRMGQVDPGRDALLYRHVSPFNLTEIITRLMKSSNNVVANQLLLASGASAFGAPATMEKAVRAAENYAENVLGIKGPAIAEGSGISRNNRLSAAMFLKILKAFQPCHTLLRHQEGEYYKTGTLNGIRARAGYLEGPDGELYPFVVLINTPGKDTALVIKRFKQLVR